MQCWLFKSEPTCYSFTDLEKDGSTYWDGVRNYQARNFLRDKIKKGDRVLFYHSRCKHPAIIGECEVTREGYPDHTAFDLSSDHPDPKSTLDNPRWFMVDIKPLKRYPKPVLLSTLRSVSTLGDMLILRKGNRLSVTPVEAKHFTIIQALSE